MRVESSRVESSRDLFVFSQCMESRGYGPEFEWRCAVESVVVFEYCNLYSIRDITRELHKIRRCREYWKRQLKLRRDKGTLGQPITYWRFLAAKISSGETQMPKAQATQTKYPERSLECFHTTTSNPVARTITAPKSRLHRYPRIYTPWRTKRERSSICKLFPEPQKHRVQSGTKPLGTPHPKKWLGINERRKILT